MENTNPFPRDQTGLSRNRLGNRIKKPVVLGEMMRQNKMAVKPLLARNRKEIEISKSVPDLTRYPRVSRLKISSSTAVTVSNNNLLKINSWESMATARKNSGDSTFNHSRIPRRSVAANKLKSFESNEKIFKKPKKIEMGKKIIEKNFVGKTMENKRKFACIEGISGNSKKSIMESEKQSPSNYNFNLSMNNRTEECKKIVKRIMLDKKMLEIGEKERSSVDFVENSAGILNTEEMADFLLNDLQFKHIDSSKTSNELDKSSKRNSSEFDDSIGSFFSDQTVINILKSTEILNLCDSKQDFLIDNPLDVSISEDNLTPGLTNLSNSIDRTPSAEELPMECEMEPVSGNSTVCARSTSPSEEVPQESLSSRATNPTVSIITSITSIMSLDTGYQGDGELSRPESRNTENESKHIKLPITENGISIKGINFDDGKTMTDSDFFTESDADIHDDLSLAAAEIGSGRGDRKAQVIDGTLYGGVSIQNHAVVNTDNERNDVVTSHLVNRSVTTNEDMESSGIYSDFEKKTEENCPPKTESVSYLEMITEQMKTIQNLALASAEKKSQQDSSTDRIVKSSSGESSKTVYENTSVVTSSKKSSKGGDYAATERKESTPTTKVSRMPNRNVPSKIKSFIEAAPVTEVEGKTKVVKKGKWDDVMDKIAQGKEENKYTPSKFRDVKSKVFQNIGPSYNSRRSEVDTKTPPKMSPISQIKPRRLVGLLFLL